MKKIRVGINGLGRIGRAFLKIAIEREELEVVAVNDLGDLENLAYLLRYDSAYGRYAHPVTVKEKMLVVNGHEVRVCQEKDPAHLPWHELRIDVVVESTGFFASFDKAKAQIADGTADTLLAEDVGADGHLSESPTGADTAPPVNESGETPGQVPAPAN